MTSTQLRRNTSWGKHESKWKEILATGPQDRRAAGATGRMDRCVVCTSTRAAGQRLAGRDAATEKDRPQDPLSYERLPLSRQTGQASPRPGTWPTSDSLLGERLIR